MEMGAPRWAWTGRLKPSTLDWLIVGVLFVLGAISSGADRFTEPPGGSLTTGWLIVVALALLLLQTVPLAWRRTQSSLVLALVAIAFGLKVLLGINTSVAGLGLLIGMYSVAAYELRRRRVLFLGLAGVGFVAGFVVFGVTGNPRSFALSVPSLAFVAAWLVGDYLRTRRAYVAELEDRAARLERERDNDRVGEPLSSGSRDFPRGQGRGEGLSRPRRFPSTVTGRTLRSLSRSGRCTNRSWRGTHPHHFRRPPLVSRR
jgi:hypothetical protein